MIAQIKKRDGRIVDFDSKKIVNALRQAFAALGQDVTEEQLGAIVDDAVLELANRFVDATPGVEDVQNIVEKKLMASGFFEVARSYIIYRYEHSKVRDQQRQSLQEKIERSDLTVVKRSGQKEKFSLKKLKNSFSWVVKGFESDVDIDLMVKQTEANLFDGIKTVEIAKARVLAARSLIERDPAYSRVAVRLLFDSLYREVIGQKLDYKNLDHQYRQAFINNLKMGVQIGRLDPRLFNFNLEALSRQLKLERDDLFFYLGGQTLYDRYFISNPKTKSILETPQAFWLRVAMGLAVNEDEAEARALQFYDLISSLRFIPSTPTLFHAGTKQPQLSSCYLTTIEDSLDHIFKCVGDNAQMSKWSGGVANDWTNLRATGALI